MRHAILAFALGALAAAARADAPWGDADPNEGKALHDKACISCHARMYGGDGSKIYTHDGRIITNRLELLQRVAACNSQVRAGWFPEEEASVAAWLNQRYYRFDK